MFKKCPNLKGKLFLQDGGGIHQKIVVKTEAQKFSIFLTISSKKSCTKMPWKD